MGKCIQRGARRIFVFVGVLALALGFALGEGALAAEPEIASFVDRHCAECHDDLTAEADLDLLALAFRPDDPANRERWIHVFDRIEKGEMPPADSGESVPDTEREAIVRVLGDALARADREAIRDGGRGPLRRLTRSEYEDTLRDLLELPDLEVADYLPEDRDRHGFSRVTDLLGMSRVQLAGYLEASEVALSVAVAGGVEPLPPQTWRFTGTDLFSSTETFGGREAMFFAKRGKWVPISGKSLGEMTEEERRDPELELALFRSATWPYYGYPRGFRAPHDGDYRVRFSGRAVMQLPGFRLVPASDPMPMSFRSRQPSGPDVSGDVQETGGWMDLEAEAREFETTIRLRAGETFEYSLLGLPVPFIRTDGGFFYDYPPMPPEGHRGAAIRWLEVEGPLSPEQWPPASHRVLFGDLPVRAGKGGAAVEVVSAQPEADAERLLRAFAARAAHRPMPEESLEVFLDLVREELAGGVPFAEALLKGYQAFLCSGHFLYLVEPLHGDAHALAGRLSGLLWNSRPDDLLREKARSGRLGDAAVLLAEADRLIAGDRFERFVRNFTDQWLELRELRRDIPDGRLYPEYRKDDYLVDSMERETRSFFSAMVRDNLPVTTLVDSDFTFLNDRLARHYGLARVPGSSMRRVGLPEWSPYGGILTQASILKLTSNGTTTSPVLRGVWVMEKILGEPPPPPPKSVPAIQPDIRGASTIREQLAKHTESESCRTCHERFDPVGFALESFDVMGAWRDRYRGLEKGEKITGYDPAGHPFQYFVGPEVDSAGRLRTGEEFADVIELKAHLVARPRQLARNLLHQLTLYATGTPVRFSEREEIEGILDHCEGGGYRVRDLLERFLVSSLFAGIAEPGSKE